jgi:hypothetical protein
LESTGTFLEAFVAVLLRGAMGLTSEG